MIPGKLVLTVLLFRVNCSSFAEESCCVGGCVLGGMARYRGTIR